MLCSCFQRKHPDIPVYNGYQGPKVPAIEGMSYEDSTNVPVCIPELNVLQNYDGIKSFQCLCGLYNKRYLIIYNRFTLSYRNRVLYTVCF